VLLAVADTGVGMTAEVLERAVEPFFDQNLGHGTELGLSMVYGFVKQSGGHVKIESAESRHARTAISAAVMRLFSLRTLQRGNRGALRARSHDPAGRGRRRHASGDCRDARECSSR
jgi:signal transduction histidine kinase